MCVGAEGVERSPAVLTVAGLSFKLSVMCVHPAGASTLAPYLCQDANHSSGGSEEESGHASMCQRVLQYNSYYLTIADAPPVYKSLTFVIQGQ